MRSAEATGFWSGTAQPILSRKPTVLNYCVIGQICIAKDFRGRGMLQRLYQEMSVAMKEVGFDFIVTGVARINLRSRRAHEDVGFRPLPQPSEYQVGRCLW